MLDMLRTLLLFVHRDGLVDRVWARSCRRVLFKGQNPGTSIDVGHMLEVTTSAKILQARG